MLTTLDRAPTPAPATHGPTIPERLRTETRDLHEKIERNPWFSRLMAPDLDRDQFRAIAARLYGHHAPAEAALLAGAALLPRQLALAQRMRRTRLLEADLRAMGLSDEAIASLPRHAAPSIERPEDAWGLLYVLEGSTLGGQLIARHVAALLGIDASSGASALVPHGAETGALWRGFREALTEAGRSGEACGDRVVAAARTAFAGLDDWVAATR